MPPTFERILPQGPLEAPFGGGAAAISRVGGNAVVTGSSRGIGAGDAEALAGIGMDVAGNHVDPSPKKSQKQQGVGDIVRSYGRSFTDTLADITLEEGREAILLSAIGSRENPRPVDALILNAAGGLESGKSEGWAELINNHSQNALVDLFLPYMGPNSRIVFNTSWWAYMYRQAPQPPGYGAVARSKKNGENQLMSRIPELEESGIKFGIVVGNVTNDTGAHTIFEKYGRDELAALEKRSEGGKFPDPIDMGNAARDLVQYDIEQGQTVFVGGTHPERLLLPDHTLNRREVHALLSMYGESKLLLDTFGMVGEDEGKGSYNTRARDTHGHFSGRYKKFRGFDIFRGVDEGEALAQNFGVTFLFTEGPEAGLAVYQELHMKWKGMVFTGETVELVTRITGRTKESVIGEGTALVQGDVVGEAPRMVLGIIPTEKQARSLVGAQKERRARKNKREAGNSGTTAE